MRFGKIENNQVSKILHTIFAFLILCNCAFSAACQSNEEQYEARLEQCVELGHTKADESVICLEKLLKSNPTKGMIYLFLARNYEDLGQLDKAEQAIEVFVQAYPLYASGRQTYCKILMDKGALADALSECTKAIQIQPEDIFTRLTTATIHEEMGNLKLAESTYQEALNINPKDVAALVFLGSFYERRGKLDDAITTLEKAVELKPDNYKKIEEGIQKLREKRKLQQPTEKPKAKSKASGQN